MTVPKEPRFEPSEDASIGDIMKAMKSIPAPTCFEDYTKVYLVKPGGIAEEIKPGHPEYPSN